MSTIDVYNFAHDKVSELELDDAVFGADVKEHLLYSVVRYQLAKRRQGTHKVKGRTEVSGGGRKPFKQKGTGRARAGTIRAPHWRGGGSVFGPRPRSYAFKLNKKVRASAMRSALSRRAAEDAIVVMDAVDVPGAKTKEVVAMLERFAISDVLIVASPDDVSIRRSAKNLQNVTVVPPEGLNVYDILRRRHLMMTSSAVAAVSARLGA